MYGGGFESQCLFGLLEVILAGIAALKGMWELWRHERRKRPDV